MELFHQVKVLLTFGPAAAAAVFAAAGPAVAVVALTLVDVAVVVAEYAVPFEMCLISVVLEYHSDDESLSL